VTTDGGPQFTRLEKDLLNGFLSNTTIQSNIATTTALIPMFTAMAVGLGIAPISIIIRATIAASCAFMLPVATPPNAIVFGSGYLRIPQMARASIWLNLIAIFVVTITTHFLVSWIF
jgi:sodium-dependent dicarboxylate transporter 2/3/5